MRILTKDKTKGLLALAASILLLGLTSLLIFLCPMGPRSAKAYLAGGLSDRLFAIGLICLIVFFVCVVLTAILVVNFFAVKDNKFKFLRIAALINFVVAAVVCVVSIVSNQIFYPLGFLILALVLFALVTISAGQTQPAKAARTGITIAGLKENIKGTGQSFGSIAVVCAALAALLAHSFVLLFVPVASAGANNAALTIVNIFAHYSDYGSVYQILSIAFVVLLIINCVLFFNLIIRFFVDTEEFLQTGKAFAIYNIVLTIGLMTYSFVMMVIDKFYGKEILFVTYINALIAYGLYAVFVVFAGRARKAAKEKAQKTAVITPRRRKNGLSELVFLAIMTAVTLSMFFVRLYSLQITAPTSTVSKAEMPFEVLKNLSSQNVLGNAVAFMLVVISIISVVFLILTLFNYLMESEDYKASAKQYAYANLFFQILYLAAGLFYVLMVPAVDGIFQLAFGSFLDGLGIGVSLEDYIEVGTLSYIPFLIGFVVIMFMQIFCWHPQPAAQAAEDEGKSGQNIAEVVVQAEPQTDEAPAFDPCPTFSDLDARAGLYKDELEKLQAAAFTEPTLQSLTQFVVKFAAHAPERLSYTHDAVATFIAGLGASRLSILQGMSGTGKTSLPKAFMQAIGGNCEIVEVESSWRDKNELLGYYNEFNGIYAPKKFTQYLYKAALNPEIPTFIVLDELNLSRIEYYFSDFLSLMEAREDQRAVNLLNRRIYPPAVAADGGKPAEYYALSDGNTLKIPTNVWFIGTANRDESTFEISDKVYDRAQTMNFDRRAPKITSPKLDIPMRFVEYDKLNKLLTAARQTEFNAESDPRVLAVEKMLLPYKISFGNRILKQIEDFVKVYIACFDTSTLEKYRQIQHRGLENILFSKVLRKLELKVVENKAQLIQGFEKLHFGLCAQFVRQLDDN